MAYHLEDLFQSINDIFYQFDEGEVSAAEAEKMAERCCHAFIKDKMTDKETKMQYSLAVAFGRGILDGEQIDELLTIYKGATK
ncbi:MAG: hypothetical protein WCG04_06135 [Alphaproteobacteria bacterium]